MAVVDELARGKNRRHEIGAIDDRVEAAFEKPDQMLRGVAATPDSLVVDVLELPLRDVAVVALELLLGAQLNAEIGELLLAPLAVLAGAVFAVVNGALRPAPDVLTVTTVDLVFGLYALGQPKVLGSSVG